MNGWKNRLESEKEGPTFHFTVRLGNMSHQFQLPPEDIILASKGIILVVGRHDANRHILDRISLTRDSY